jgi:radical SAM superfamily enzyme YgiQ (UPF0313 family)
MDLAKRSGLLHVNLGLESINQEALNGMNKKINKVKEYKEILQNLRKRGISYSLNFIFGWDTEKEDVFGSTLEFLKEEKVPVAYFSILTPHKGTPLYEQMKEQKRIIDIDHIGRWPGINCYIQPSYCSAAELEQYLRKISREFYSYPSMLKRLPLPVTQANIASWVVNLSQRKISFSEKAIENFDHY